MEEVGEIALRYLEPHAVVDLDTREAVAARVLVLWRAEEIVRRAPVDDQPQHLAGDLPHAEDAEGVVALLRGQLQHLRSVHPREHCRILRRLNLVTRARALVLAPWT